MKKIFLLIICTAFSFISNAQTLYVVNNLNPTTIDVQGIAKLTSACNSINYCLMSDMMAIGASSLQVYPTGCTGGPNINLTVYEGTYFIQIQYCGTPQSGSWGPGNSYGYSLDLVPGAYPDVILKIY